MDKPYVHFSKRLSKVRIRYPYQENTSSPCISLQLFSIIPWCPATIFPMVRGVPSSLLGEKPRCPCQGQPIQECQLAHAYNVLANHSKLLSGPKVKKPCLLDLNSFGLPQGHHFDLQALLAGVVYQGLKSFSHIVRNPICPALRTDGRRNITDHHHAKTQFRGECRRAWLLFSPAKRAGIALASLLHVVLLVLKSASKWDRSGSYAVITNTCSLAPSKAAKTWSGRECIQPKKSPEEKG